MLSWTEVERLNITFTSNKIYPTILVFSLFIHDTFPLPSNLLFYATMTTLFELPILSSPSSPPIGTIVCTTSPSSPNTYLLTFTAPPDNRMVTGFCQAFLLALDIIECSYPPGVLVTTSGIPKFYSNGLDLNHVNATKGFWDQSLAPVFKRLLLYAKIFHGIW